MMFKKVVMAVLAMTFLTSGAVWAAPAEVTAGEADNANWRNMAYPQGLPVEQGSVDPRLDTIYQEMDSIYKDIRWKPTDDSYLQGVHKLFDQLNQLRRQSIGANDSIRDRLYREAVKLRNRLAVIHANINFNQ